MAAIFKHGRHLGILHVQRPFDVKYLSQTKSLVTSCCIVSAVASGFYELCPHVKAGTDQDSQTNETKQQHFHIHLRILQEHYRDFPLCV